MKMETRKWKSKIENEKGKSENKHGKSTNENETSENENGHQQMNMENRTCKCKIEA